MIANLPRNLPHLDVNSVIFCRATDCCCCGKLRADVAAYAQGPWSHLMVGTVEQTHIHDVMLCE